jgi:hypothetical protein
MTVVVFLLAAAFNGVLAIAHTLKGNTSTARELLTLALLFIILAKMEDD